MIVERLSEWFKGLRFTLRFSILAIFITLFIITTLSIVTLRSWTFAKELTYTSFETMHYAAEAVQQQLNVGLQPASRQAQFTARLLSNGVLKEDAATLIPYTFFLAQSMPLAKRVYWANEQGDYLYSLKANNGLITTEIFDRSHFPHTRITLFRDAQGNIINRLVSFDLTYDPRQGGWYQTSKKLKRFYWTDVHVFHPHVDIGIGAIAPVLNHERQFTSLFGINISLDYLSQFMTNLKVSEHGFAFIITPTGDLVAYPNRPPFNQLSSKEKPIIKKNPEVLPVIYQSFEKYQKTNEIHLSIKHNHQIYLVTYLPSSDLLTNGWLIGVVTPRDDFIGSLRKMNWLTLGISMLFLLLGIYLVSHLITRVVRPIRLLANETDKIRHFHLEGKIKVSSRITEIIGLADAIRSMKIGLKSFQKYVPRGLVEQLIEVGEDARIGGTRKPLVIFFSDIQNFTAIAESIDPSQLTLQLCDYFEALTQIIMAERGTIDKYIGDAIMAFWGAPLPVKNSAKRAARAALKSEAKLDELNAAWVKQGKPAFVTRIGIHAGDAIVGNLGSTERLSYTALGDTVNTASRLEEVNKTYKTRVIVSEPVYQQIKDEFHLRLIDSVTMKGKTHTICIYELLGEKNTPLSFDLNAYNQAFKQGFEAFQQQDWQKAKLYFKQCLTIYPEDSVAPIFIQRCGSDPSL